MFVFSAALALKGYSYFKEPIQFNQSINQIYIVVGHLSLNLKYAGTAWH